MDEMKLMCVIEAAAHTKDGIEQHRDEHGVHANARERGAGAAAPRAA